MQYFSLNLTSQKKETGSWIETEPVFKYYSSSKKNYKKISFLSNQKTSWEDTITIWLFWNISFGRKKCVYRIWPDINWRSHLEPNKNYYMSRLQKLIYCKPHSAKIQKTAIHVR